MDTVTQGRDNSVARPIEDRKQYVGRQLATTVWRPVAKDDVDAFTGVMEVWR